MIYELKCEASSKEMRLKMGGGDVGSKAIARTLRDVPNTYKQDEVE